MAAAFADGWSDRDHIGTRHVFFFSSLVFIGLFLSLHWTHLVTLDLAALGVFLLAFSLTVPLPPACHR